MIATELEIKEFSEQIGIDQHELIRQSLLMFIWGKLREVKTELFVLQKEYNVETVYEFEKLYEEDKIDDNRTFGDYQKFDRLVYELELFEEFIKKFRNG